MRYRSKKREKQQEAYIEAKKLVLKRDKTCVCDRWSKVKCLYVDGPDYDHIISLGRGGKYTDPNNIQLMCRVDHNMKDMFPILANTIGLNGKERQELEHFRFQQGNPEGDWDDYVLAIKQCWDHEKKRTLGIAV